MRSKKALYNIIASFGLQVVIAISGLIVPRFILTAFGSDVNGLVSSITQFLSYIALVEGGIGGVTRAALYKPLADNDIEQLSVVTKTTEQFFKRISYFFIAYIFLLMIFYPSTVNESFSVIYIVTLIAILAVSNFGKYYFGITYQTLLQADQKNYVTSLVQIMTTIVNTVFIVGLVTLDATIHVVKLASAVVFLIRPVILNFYVKSHYNLDTNAKPDSSSIKQKWAGIGHHMAYFIHQNTDVVVLTLLSTLAEVSVYTVYRMVLRSISSIVKIFTSSLEAAFGNMINKKETENLIKTFKMVDTGSSVITISVFLVASLTITSFIRIYTAGITDAEYIRPFFAQTILAAEAIYALRQPYQSIALAAGKYNETKNGAFIEALTNITLSIVLVYFIGLPGVAIGTFVAMLYRTSDYMIFATKNILFLKKSYLIKRQFVNILTVVITLVAANLFSISSVDSYIQWFLSAAGIGIMVLLISIITNFVFYKKEMLMLTKKFTKL